MRVVKLGGSLLEGGQMIACLNQILHQNLPTIVVLGGGAFANQIRNAQKKWLFHDVAAHQMAILAMCQMAILCQSLVSQFILWASIDKTPRAPFAIWLPDLNEINAAHIKASWDVTSDSLAAWLATRIRAEELIVVKSCEIDPAWTLAQLAQKGILDVVFETELQKSDLKWRLLSSSAFLAT